MLKIEVNINSKNMTGNSSINEVQVVGNRVDSLEAMRKAKDGDINAAIEVIYNFLIVRGIDNAVSQIAKLMDEDFDKALEMALITAKESLSDEQRMS